MVKANVEQLMQKARSFEKRRDFSRAHECYSAILADYPNNPRAKRAMSSLTTTRLGSSPTQAQLDMLSTLYGKGEYDQLISQTEQLIAVFPNSFILRNIVGAAHSALSQFEEAEEAFDNAVRINPSHVDALINLIGSKKAQGKIDEAIRCSKKLVKLHSKLLDAHIVHAELLLIKKYDFAALSHLEKAHVLDPQNTKVLNSIGDCQLSLGLNEKAKEQFLKVVALEPENVTANNALGDLYLNADNQEAAIEHYTKTIEVEPNNGDNYVTLAIALHKIGNTSLAMKNCRKALDIDPNNINAHIQVDQLARHEQGNGMVGDIDDRVEQMNRLLDNEKINNSQKASVSFYLATLYEKGTNYDLSFKHTMQGNRFRQLVVEQQQETGMKEAIKSELFRIRTTKFEEASGKIRPKAPNARRKRPIFIVGMPRSGTTLCEQIISNHPSVYGCGELSYISQLADRVFDSNGRISLKNLEFFRNSYLDRLYELDDTHPAATDKMPHNFLFIGIIATAFPEAKIVHMVRDARATCWSGVKHEFASDLHDYSYDLLDMAEHYRMYREVMDFWHSKFPGRIYDQNYERLTENQEEETRKLISHVELEWDDACLSFHQNKRTVNTMSASQIRKPIYQGSSQEWQNYANQLKPLTDRLEQWRYA